MIARRTPLKRTPFKRGVKRTKYAKRERAFEFMLFVKRLPCCACAIAPDSKCNGPVEADHAGRRGIGQKASDFTCIPLCSKHHRERHGFCGAFKGWDQEKMRGWLEQRIGITQRIAIGKGIEVMS
jgi:hypothetical protein